VADDLGIKLKTVYFGEEYLRMLKNPKYGYGSGMNPCIDCRAMMYRAAKEHLDEIGGDFIITGEVLHQRPMSQNERALRIIESEAGSEGRVLRPLSANVLPETIAERNGLIKRQELGRIQGRSRKVQLELAKQFGISEPPNAAGGCLLTDPAFSKRVRDLFDHTDHIPSINDIELLKVGRHFRLADKAKIVVGRNEQENDVIKALKQDEDITFEALNFVGPTGLLRAPAVHDGLLEICCSIVLRYSDAPKDSTASVSIMRTNNNNKNVPTLMETRPIHDDILDNLRI
jgi:tRNA U34 2-thiouridine synthase MnmA/TrmU